MNWAIEIDPQFAEPYAEIAVILSISSQWHDDPNATLRRAQEAIDTALSLKPDLARAHAAQALLMSMSPPPTDLTKAEALLRKAIALDPNQLTSEPRHLPSRTAVSMFRS